MRMSFELSPRRALSTLTDDGQAAWRLRHCPQESLGMRTRTALAKVERELRVAGAAMTWSAVR